MDIVAAWLRMNSVGNEEFPSPSSEEEYNAHLDTIDIAIPTNGGTLDINGEWVQNSELITGSFAQGFPALATANSQLYIPMVNCDSDMTTVLDSTALKAAAAANLIALAKTDRFDAPWDGVCVDFESVPSTYRIKMSNFYHLLAYQCHLNGLILMISMRAFNEYPGSDYDATYANNVAEIAKAADYVNFYTYNYVNPIRGRMKNRSLAPHWWIESCIQYGIAQGIPNEKMILGLASYNYYFQTSTDSTSIIEVSHTKANSLATNAGVEWEFIDDLVPVDDWLGAGQRTNMGAYREYYAEFGNSHIWKHNAETLEHSLDLIDQYELKGMSDFILGMGENARWTNIAAHKS